MSNSSIKDLEKALKSYFEEYVEDIEEDVKESVNEITKKAKKELITTSPRDKKNRKDKYYRGWAIKVSKNQKNKYHKVIYNKSNYQLTHLLEFGHATRNGGRTKAIPHIRPVEEKYSVEFTDLVKKRIRRRSK